MSLFFCVLVSAPVARYVSASCAYVLPLWSSFLPGYHHHEIQSVRNTPSQSQTNAIHSFHHFVLSSLFPHYPGNTTPCSLATR